MNYLGTKIISLNRIVLTKFNENDYLDLYEYASNDEVTKFLTWESYTTIDDAKNYLKNVATKYDSKTFRWAIRLKENNKLIGAIDVTKLDETKEEVEIGYVLNPLYQNQGLMKEALKGVTKYLFNSCLVNRIIIRCNIDNLASYKVMKGCGYIDYPKLRNLKVKNKDVVIRYTYLTRTIYNYFLSDRYIF